MVKAKKFSVLALVIFFVIVPVLRAQVVKDDFRVNDDTTGGSNSSSVVGITKNGEEVVVWPDGRNGNYNIYGQAYDSAGNGMGANFKLSTNNAQNYEPRTTISSYGDSLLVIFEYGYGQWLLSDGSQSGISFSLQSGNIIYPDVAVGDSGFFVVWDSYMGGAGGYEIFVKRFDFDGDSLGSGILVNDDGTTYNQRSSKIAMAGNGNFVVVWYDYRNGNDYDIYGQLFNSSGYKIGSNFKINDDAGTDYQYYPSCAMDFAGNFVVVWQDDRNSNADIYGQRFAPDGDTTGLGGNFLINDDGGTEYQYRPSCSMDSAGNFVVVWYDGRGYGYDIYGQLYDNIGAVQGANFWIDQCSGSESQFDPEVSMNESNFVVAWRDNRNSTSIYKRSYYNNGTPVSSEIKVNDVGGTMQQYNPVVDMNVSGNVVVAWEDQRDPGGVYFQRLTSQGEPIGDNSLVHAGYIPSVSVHKDGSYVITYFYYDGNIYANRYDDGGNPIGSSLRINDTTGVNPYSEKIDMDTLGNFTVVWYDSRSGSVDIYGQRFDSSGDTIDENFKVNDDVGTSEQYYPSIAYSSSGRFLITWEDYRNLNSDIFGQIYGANGSPIGSNFRIDDDPGAGYQNCPNAASLADGNFIIVWEDNRVPYGVYGQVIDTAGNPIGTNFRVSDVSASSPSVAAFPAGGFVVTWYDYRDGNYNIYAQNHKPDYSPDSVNYKVNNEVEGLNQYQLYPDVATNGTNIIFTWRDSKWQKGWDVAAKVFGSSSGIDNIIQEGKGLKILGLSSPILRSKEWLAISLGSPAKVEFRIINVAGIVVSSQELTYDTPGIKRVDFDVSKLPSGPYFLSLETEKGRAIKKTVVIK
jgi:hypothetical protein